jgi:plasmid stabilization system protein ParE
MRFTVTWHPAAESELADIWVVSTERSQVAQAANEIERRLSTDPFAHGEEFYGDRLIVVSPLAVTYTTRELDRLVQVLQVWSPGR